MQYKKGRLIAISQKFTANQALSPEEISYLLGFEKKSKEPRYITYSKRAAIPLSLALGFASSAFPKEFSSYVEQLPAWTNFQPFMLSGVDYLWDLLGDPVGRANVIYHIPNIVLYSFGIVGVKKIMEALDKRTWLDKVYAAKTRLLTRITEGSAVLKLKKGHSILFVGGGDFIGMQYVLDHDVNDSVTISHQKPSYTKIWNYYDIQTLYDDLKLILHRADGKSAGEYMFFPVKDDQIFLPGPTAYDLSPHKLDILCQNIRVIEHENHWKAKRIIIIGDKFHKSFVQSENHKKVIPKSEDIISLESIAKKYENVTLLDPTDIVLTKILSIAKGRQIVFRATKEGIAEYKERFYHRLGLLGYKPSSTKKGVLTIGYDLFEDQTEQQTLAKKIDDYFPVVLSRSVHDALLRNGYKKEEFLYVPELVLDSLSSTAAQQ